MRLGASFHVCTCARSTDVETFDRDLRRSLAIARGDVKLTILWNQPSASGACARAIAGAREDILILSTLGEAEGTCTSGQRG
jgi:hypothetical protein